MNLSVLILAACAWSLLFLQGLHVSPNGPAPWFFLGAGVCQWVAGCAFPGFIKELKTGEWRFW